MDPWREIATELAGVLSGIDGIGVVVVGHLPELETWPDFLEQFTTETEDGDLLEGWQIVEPLGGNAVQTAGNSLNDGVVEDRFTFFIRGFRAMAESPAESQDAFRDTAWAVKKALDSKVHFTLTDSDVIHVVSWPSSGASIMPGLFGDLEAWMTDLTKVVTVQREITFV
ncbi:MAG: hypothetical protein IPH08_03645 [Rhodocyclaceae bacterium]|nr:hypothetical protein [Rhodocyclaceae bacterium]MBK6906246.1 hypothetical protein [Rhodocyclaceae bacterium]